MRRWTGLALIAALLLGVWLWPDASFDDLDYGSPVEASSPRVQFRIRDEDGGIPRGIEVSLRGPGLSSRFARPDARGFAELESQAGFRREGLFRLRVAAPGWRTLDLALPGRVLEARAGSAIPVTLFSPAADPRLAAMGRARVALGSGIHLAWRWSPPTGAGISEGPRAGRGWPEGLPGAGRLRILAYRLGDEGEEAWWWGESEGFRPCPRSRLESGLPEGTPIALSQAGAKTQGSLPARRLHVGSQGWVTACDLRDEPHSGPARYELRWIEVASGRPRQRVLVGL